MGNFFWFLGIDAKMALVGTSYWRLRAMEMWRWVVRMSKIMEIAVADPNWSKRHATKHKQNEEKANTRKMKKKRHSSSPERTQMAISKACGKWSLTTKPRACGRMGPRGHGPRASMNLKREQRQGEGLSVAKRLRDTEAWPPAPPHLHTPLHQPGRLIRRIYRINTDQALFHQN